MGNACACCSGFHAFLPRNKLEKLQVNPAAFSGEGQDNFCATPVISAAQARNALRLDAIQHFLNAGSPLTMQEEMWMTEEILGVYIRARGTSAERLRILVEALQWRIAHRETLASLDCPYCMANPLSHDARLFGFDNDGDFVFMNCFALPRDISVDSVTRHMTCLLDRALKEFPEAPDAPFADDGHPKVRQWTYIFDLHGFGMRYYDARVPLRLLELFQVVHRGRLKKMICLDAPFGFGNFFNIVRPFMKPATREKLEFSSWESIRPSLQATIGTSLTAELYDEAIENRDPDSVAVKTWTTFYGNSLHEAQKQVGADEEPRTEGKVQRSDRSCVRAVYEEPDVVRAGQGSYWCCKMRST